MSIKPGQLPVLSEWKTESYAIYGSAAPNVHGQLLAEDNPSLGLHEVLLPENDFAVLRLVEREASGRHIQRGIAAGSNRNSVRDRQVSVARRERANEFRRNWPYHLKSLERSPESSWDYVIFTVDPFTVDVQNLVESYWEARGLRVLVSDLTQFEANERQQVILDLIHLYHTNFDTNNFHIVGDQADGFYSKVLWESSDYWRAVRAAYDQLGVFNRSDDARRRAIPTFVIPDVEEDGTGTYVKSAPFLLSDQPYGDLDGDTIPDVTVTRWPVNSADDVVFAAEKMRQHNDGFAFGDASMLSLVGNGDGNNGLFAEMIADEFQATVRSYNPWEQITSLHETDVLDASARQDSVLSRVNQYRPELVTVVASASNGFHIGHMIGAGISEPFPVNAMTPGNIIPLVLAATCNGADWDYAYQDTVRVPCELFLFDSGDRGAVGWIGPMGGSWQTANRLLGDYVLQELYSDPSRSMAESWLVAVQRAYADAATQDERDTIGAYVFLGDPLSPFRPTPAATITTKVRKPDQTELVLPEHLAIGCPQGDEDEIVISVRIDSTGLVPPIPASALTVGQPKDSTVVFYAAEADSAFSLDRSKYRTTITIPEFGGCGVDSAEVRLYDLPIGMAHFRVRSPDYHHDPGTSSWGFVEAVDFGFFGSHCESSPCNCVYPKPYNECANYGPTVQDTLVGATDHDFPLFGSHFDHGYSGGGQAVSPVFAYSAGAIELDFEEEQPLLGPRKLKATVSVRNAELFRSLVVIFKNENEKLRFAGWQPNPEYEPTTLAAAIDRRTGTPEIILGVMGDKATSSQRLTLGTIELDVLSTEPLTLTEDDLAIVHASLLEVNGSTLAFGGSQVERTAEAPVFENALAQNYPNPFNPTTTISYSIRDASRVALRVYNVRGQLVRTLVDDNQTPKVHRVTWDGRSNSGTSVASGIYFYRIIAGDFRATRKMVLLR